MHSRKKIFVIAGELSGDQIGGLLLRNIKKNNYRVITIYFSIHNY